MRQYVNMKSTHYFSSLLYVLLALTPSVIAEEQGSHDDSRPVIAASTVGQSEAAFPIPTLFSLPSLPRRKKDDDDDDDGKKAAHQSTLTVTQTLGADAQPTLLAQQPKPAASGVIGGIPFITAASSASQQFLSDSEFQTSVLNSTNTIRRQHNATALAWNMTLMSYAQNWSGRCRMRSSKGPFGENLAASHADVTTSIDAWSLSNLQLPANKTVAIKDLHKLKSAAKFTQLVWKNSTQVGCGRTNCAGQNGVMGWEVVCEFSPKGNVVGLFEENVQVASVGDSKGGVIGGQDGGNAATALPGLIGAQMGSGKATKDSGTIGNGRKSDGGRVLDRVQVWGVFAVVWLVFAAVLM